MKFPSLFGGGSGNCANCGNAVLSTRDFEAECTKAGFDKDPATGRFKMKVGGLAGPAESVFARLGQQQTGKQARFDQIEGQRGYRCVSGGHLYCMNCLYAVAPAHPRGGKGCPKCGSTFEHYE